MNILSETSTRSVEIELHDGIAVVRIVRPDSMNAINGDIREALLEQLPVLDADDRVRALILTGQGKRAFCAGQDLDEAAEIEPSNVALWLNRLHATYNAIRIVDKPMVAALNGTAVGAGLQLALLCDFRIAHAQLLLGQPEVKAGLASIVGSYLMSLQIGHSLNQQLSMTGELISGERAYQLGLVNEIVPAEDVLEVALARARALAAIPKAAFRTTKQRFRETTQPGFDEACNAGIRYQLECYASGEPKRVMREFLARRGQR